MEISQCKIRKGKIPNKEIIIKTHLHTIHHVSELSAGSIFPQLLRMENVGAEFVK